MLPSGWSGSDTEGNVVMTWFGLVRYVIVSAVLLAAAAVGLLALPLGVGGWVVLGGFAVWVPFDRRYGPLEG